MRRYHNTCTHPTLDDEIIEAVYDTRGICVLNDVGVGSNERLRSKDKGKVGG